MVMKRKERIPKYVRACIWFTDPDVVDWQDQKDMIITSVLNRGTWDAVRWIFHYYNRRDIQEIVSNPKRGLWEPKSLRFWTTFFEITLEDAAFEEALIKM
jgi:hypothetical protein